jgi:hypothetical protein
MKILFKDYMNNEQCLSPRRPEKRSTHPQDKMEKQEYLSAGN